MFSVKKISIITVGTIAIGLGSVKPVSAASLYAITGLDFLPSDINDSAQVVGQNYLWQNGNVIDLNTLPGANNRRISASGINNNGAIVGSIGPVSATGLASFISDGNTISDLPITFCNNIIFCSASVADINDSGTLAIDYDSRLGLVQQSDGTTRQAFLTRTLLNIAINNQDQVVGTGIFSGGFVNGIVSVNGSQRTLIAAGANPNTSFPLSRSNANDIDDLGNIVGSSGIFSPSTSAFEATLWEDIAQPGVSLGTLGGNISDALGINNSQQIVGFSTLSDSSTRHAFLWEEGSLIDLNSLVDPGIGWELTSAFEINNNGDIIGIGNFNGEQRGFIATAVPEPTSVLGVLGLGLFGLSNWRKRKK